MNKEYLTIKIDINNDLKTYESAIRHSIKILSSYINTRINIIETGETDITYSSDKDRNSNGTGIKIPFDNELYKNFEYREDIDKLISSLIDNGVDMHLKDQIMDFDLIGLIFQLINLNHSYKIKKPFLAVILKQLCNKYLNYNFDQWDPERNIYAVLTHDVDQININSFPHSIRYFEYAFRNKSFKSLKYGISQMIKSLALPLEKNQIKYDEYINLEEKYNARSTYFFTCLEKDRDSRDPLYKLNSKLKYGNITVSELIKKLTAENFEIGLHKSIYSSDNKEKMQDEIISFKKIYPDLAGLRAHLIKIGQNDYYTYKDLGLQYDSSFGYNDILGYRSGHFMPFYPFVNGQSLSFLIIPFMIMDSILAHNDGYPKNKEQRQNYYNIIKEHIDGIIKLDGIISINWHFRSANRYRMPYMFDIYKNIIEELYNRNVKFLKSKEINIKFRNYLDKFFS